MKRGAREESAQPKKRKKKAVKIPRHVEFIPPPIGPEALWTKIEIQENDVVKLVSNIGKSRSSPKKNYNNVARKIEGIINSFIRDWMFQKKSTPSEYYKWAKNIEDAAKLLLSCLGTTDEINWRGLPLDTAGNLLMPCGHESFVAFRNMQKKIGLSCEIDDTIDYAGAAVFVLRAIAGESAKSYETQKIERKDRHKKDEALLRLFVEICKLYRHITGQEPRVSNGSSKQHGSAKGKVLKFSEAFLKLIASKMGHNTSGALENSHAAKKSERSLAVFLKEISSDFPKMARLIQQAKNHPLYKK